MSDNTIKTNLEWTSSLDIDYQANSARKTSIICTIGRVVDPCPRLLRG
jgi:pyruvate kinase